MRRSYPNQFELEQVRPSPRVKVGLPLLVPELGERRIGRLALEEVEGRGY